MKKLQPLGAAYLFFAAITTTVNASLVVPEDLEPGDKYHVIFVTSAVTTATSSDIAFYDAFVQSAADTAGIGVTIGLAGWRALGSAQSVDAIDHLRPLFSSTSDVPIYNQNGELVSSSFDGLWDGSIDNPIRYDEYGVETDNPFAWTGSSLIGTGTSPGRLGDSTPIFGLTGDSAGTWIAAFVDTATVPNALYALSEEISAPVPVPAAVWLFGSGLMGTIGVARRKKGA